MSRVDPPRILVVEDDPAMAAGMVRGLRRAGFEVELATDGATGLLRALEPTVDLVVLDLMLPQRSGEELLRRLRARSRTPVIVVTAQTELAKRLEVFALGALDYLPKPFFVEELIARIQARLDLERAPPPRSVSFGPVVFATEARQLLVDGTPTPLTPIEAAVLTYLVERPGRVVERNTLATALSDPDNGGARNVDAHVARLRKKLGEGAAHIVTVWGIGYRFDPSLGDAR